MIDDFIVDLSAHEAHRQVHIAAAIGDLVEQTDIWEAEMLAWEMLFAGLDDKQKEIYAMLIKAGILSGEDGQCISGTSGPPTSPG